MRTIRTGAYKSTFGAYKKIVRTKLFWIFYENLKFKGTLKVQLVQDYRLKRTIFETYQRCLVLFFSEDQVPVAFRIIKSK